MTRPLPSPRILLGPGPSSVTPRVLAALGRAPIGYLDPELFEMLAGLRADLRTLYGTANAFTVPLSGTGMAGMEACISNLIEPGDGVVIGVNGFFGGRMAEICRRHGANVSQVEAEWGAPVDPAAIESAVRLHARVKLVGCVHAETSTGVRTPLEPIAEIAHRYGALFLADMVTSLGGLPVESDRVGADVCYSATQKCVGSPPGLAPITANARAMEVAVRRSGPAPWFFDWKLLSAYYDSPHAYHHTVPVNLYYALRESLAEILEEGLEERWERHERVSGQLMEGLQEMGILPFAQEGYRLPTLNAVVVPARVTDEAAVRARLLTQYGLEIGGGLGALKGKVWRIGTMGASATDRNVLLLLGALKELIS